MDEARAWQPRPLGTTCAMVFFDALRIKIRDEELVWNKAVYLAIGVRCSGHQEIPGLWAEQTEGAHFWLRVMNRNQGPGPQRHPDCAVDGLKGFPKALVQTCIVHLIRHFTRLASGKNRKALTQAPRPIVLPSRFCRGRRTGSLGV